MGGMSFKCPYCDTWKLEKRALKDHLRDRHKLKNIEIVGTGPVTDIRIAKGKTFEDIQCH